MRWLLCVPLLAACGSTGSKSRVEPFRADQVIRVVHNQYRGPGSILVVENLFGRDQIELRSRPLAAGEPAVSYVPDDVMAEMLKEFEKGDYYEYARPRPANPPGLGASGELTITDANGRRLALLRIKAPPNVTPTRDQIDAAKAYQYCTRTFVEVWKAFPPQMQATTAVDPFQTRPRPR